MARLPIPTQGSIARRGPREPAVLHGARADGEPHWACGRCRAHPRHRDGGTGGGAFHAQVPTGEAKRQIGDRGKPAQYSQSGAAEKLLMTRLITPMTRAQVYGLLIKTAPGTRRCSVGE